MAKYKIAWLPNEGGEGDDLEITASAFIHKRGKEFPLLPLPKSQQAITDAGGLIASKSARPLETSPKGLVEHWQSSLNQLTPRTLL